MKTSAETKTPASTQPHRLVAIIRGDRVIDAFGCLDVDHVDPAVAAITKALWNMDSVTIDDIKSLRRNVCSLNLARQRREYNRMLRHFNSMHVYAKDASAHDLIRIFKKDLRSTLPDPAKIQEEHQEMLEYLQRELGQALESGIRELRIFRWGDWIDVRLVSVEE